MMMIPNRFVIALAACLVAGATVSDAANPISIPSGTTLRVRLESTLASDRSSPRDLVRGQLVEPIVVDGRTVVPRGSTVSGIVTDATPSGRVKGRARISLRLTELTSARNGEEYAISTRTWTKVAPSTKKKDAATIAVPAAGGAVIGAIAGGRKGAAVGAAVGGGAGTGVVLATSGDEVRLGEGHVIHVRLNAPVVVER
jgi:hypothetical protein